MSFETILQTIVDDCGGGYAAALMGLDGIAIAQVTATRGLDREDPLHGDVTTGAFQSIYQTLGIGHGLGNDLDRFTAFEPIVSGTVPVA